MNAFQNASFESSVGEIIRGDLKTASDGIQEKSNKTSSTKSFNQALESSVSAIKAGKDLKINLGSMPYRLELDSSNYFAPQSIFFKADYNSPTLISPFNSLLSNNITGFKVFGDYSAAFIEAKAGAKIQEKLKGKASADYFFLPEGSCNLSLLADAIKAYNFGKDELITLVLPENAIKAFRNSRFARWQSVEFDYLASSLDKVHFEQENSQQNIPLFDIEVQGLESPIYKLKLEDRTVLILPISNSFAKLQNKLELTLKQENAIEINPKLKEENIETNNEEYQLELSPGKAAKLLFKLLGDNFDNLPEAMLNYEGGSFTSIVQEQSSIARHLGINSLAEVIAKKWYQAPDLAIPWNFLGFDQITERNKYLLEDDTVFKLSFSGSADGISYIEAPQGWKKTYAELIPWLVRNIYRHYSNIGSKKYILSNKELMLIAADSLAELKLAEINKEDTKEDFNFAAKWNLEEDFKLYLKVLFYLHKALDSRCDFFSCKTNSESINRLQYLAKIEKLLEKIDPAFHEEYFIKLRTEFGKDEKTEFTTLLDLYKSEVNKL